MVQGLKANYLVVRTFQGTDADMVLERIPVESKWSRRLAVAGPSASLRAGLGARATRNFRDLESGPGEAPRPTFTEGR